MICVAQTKSFVMKIGRSAAAFAFAAALAGCASATPTAPVSYSTVSPELAAAGGGVTVLPASEGYDTITPVTALACQRAKWDPVPTEEYALALLKQEAAKKGADGLTDVTFTKGMVSVTGNCWQNIRAKATAVKARQP